MRACFCLAAGLNKFFHKSAQMGISYIKGDGNPNDYYVLYERS